MGSQEDLFNATTFIEQHQIVPIVSHILEGLEHFEKGFEIMEKGNQFGKIVIKVSDESKETKL